METNRLIIDSVNLADKENYFLNISHDKRVLETFICNYCENINDFDFSKYLNRDDIFAIRLKENKKLIGILTIFPMDDKNIEIGYGIGSSYWNNGYATEAVKCFLKYLFNERKQETIYASFFPENVASKRIMEKVGMRYSHTNIEELTYLGIKRDLIYYKINKNDYLSDNN